MIIIFWVWYKQLLLDPKLNNYTFSAKLKEQFRFISKFLYIG